MFNFKNVVAKLQQVKLEMAEYITNEQLKKYPEQLESISEILKNERVTLIGFYEELLTDQLEVALEKITVWGKSTGETCSELGMSIDVALDELNYYRERMSQLILQEANQQGSDLITYHQAISKLHIIIDQAAQSFSVAFVKHSNDMMNRARREIEELSVPVVPLEKGVAVLPLIGSIDTYRAKLLMEESLGKASKLGVSYFILDISGVLIVDTMVANEIFQVIHALKLLGVHAVLSGIRPEIAQTMVVLGIDFKTIKTFSTLQEALSDYRKNFSAKIG